MIKSFKINFQLFAKEDAELMAMYGLNEDGTPIEAVNGDNPAINEPDLQNISEPASDPLGDNPEGLQNPSLAPEGGEAQPIEQPTAEQPLILGKFKDYSELERAYQEAQNLIGRQSTEIGELRRTEPGTSPDDVEANSDMFGGISDEELSNALFTNPKSVIQAILETAKNQTITDAKKVFETDAQRQKYIDEFFGNNSDISYMQDDFIKLSDELGNPEYALDIVRGRKAGNLNGLFNDEGFVRNNLNNETVKKVLADDSVIKTLPKAAKDKIIADYLKEVKGSQSNVNLMGSENGGANVAPKKEYGSIGDMRDDSVELLKKLMEERP